MDEIAAIDKAALRRAFNRAAGSYDAAAQLQREVADRMLERLDYVRLQPATVLDVGAGTGYCMRHLRTRYPAARIYALDIAERMLRQARAGLSWWQRWRRCSAFMVGDAEALPLREASVDLIVSNLTVQWCPSLAQTFAEFRRVLRPDGLLMFTTFGPDTLQELRAAWAQVDTHVHVNSFLDMHDVGDALMQAGFADPVMDVEHFNVTYADVKSLMHDLKAIGAHNVNHARHHGITGKRRLAAMIDAYETFRHEGRIPATHEVVYGHAWAGSAAAATPGSISIALDDVGNISRQRKG